MSAPAETVGFDPAVVRAPASGAVRSFTTPNQQRLDRDGLIGQAMSASYGPKAGPGHGELLQRLTALQYVTTLFVADRACELPPTAHRSRIVWPVR